MDLTLVFAMACAAAAGYFFWRLQDADKLRENAVRECAVALERTRLLEDADRRAKESEASADQARLLLERERAKSEERAKAAEESKLALTAMKSEFENAFKALASDALQGSQKHFLSAATEMFEQRKAAQDETLKSILEPVKETFAQFKEKIEVVEKSRIEDKSLLTEQIRAVGETMAQTQAQTGKLVNALRAAPKTRGRWGEETLRNVLELSGMERNVDFLEQKSVSTDEGIRQPDVVVRLPADRCIVIDSKVAMTAYLDAMDAPDEIAREALLVKHAQQIRTHMQQLSRKEYWQHVPTTTDFVAMFVPGENFFAAAVERDPALLQDAMKNKVLLVTPATLMAMLKAVAYGWRQERISQDAQKIADLGRELFSRMSVLADRAVKLGNALEGGVKAYNEMAATLETRVLPQARKFEEFGAGIDGKSPAEVKALENGPRQLSLEKFEPEPPKIAKGRAG